jgi:hypothetical protein
VTEQPTIRNSWPAALALIERGYRLSRVSKSRTETTYELLPPKTLREILGGQYQPKEL